MLRGFFSSLAMSCGAAARQLGLMSSAVSLAARHHRCRAAWEPHLARTRNFVTRSAAECPGRDLAVVVGSGHLLDVPLDALAGRFRQVVLADVVHPWAARRAVRRLPNVSLLEFDATGLHQDIVRLCRDKVRAPLPVPAPPVLPVPRPDFLVSLNLLSQITIRPIAALRQELADPDEAELAVLARGLVDAHLAWLPAAAQRVCLVSDYLRVVRGKAGELERVDLLHGAILPPGEDWEWLLAPRPEARADADIYHLVRGVPDCSAALTDIEYSY